MVVRDLYTALEVGVKKAFQIFREKATALGRPIEKLPNSPTSVALGALNIRKAHRSVEELCHNEASSINYTILRLTYKFITLSGLRRIP